MYKIQINRIIFLIIDILGKQIIFVLRKIINNIQYN